MLVISRKAGESFYIEDQVEVKVLEISSDKIKIGINAPRNISIVRRELKDTQEANKEAVCSLPDTDYGKLMKMVEKKQ